MDDYILITELNVKLQDLAMQKNEEGEFRLIE